MLTFEEIEDCFPEGAREGTDLTISVNAQWLHDFAHAVAAKEREACAKVCEDTDQDYNCDGSPRSLNYQCADAIRARSNAEIKRGVKEDE